MKSKTRTSNSTTWDTTNNNSRLSKKSLNNEKPSLRRSRKSWNKPKRNSKSSTKNCRASHNSAMSSKQCIKATKKCADIQVAVQCIEILSLCRLADTTDAVITCTLIWKGKPSRTSSLYLKRPLPRSSAKCPTAFRKLLLKISGTHWTQTSFDNIPGLRSCDIPFCYSKFRLSSVTIVSWIRPYFSTVVASVRIRCARNVQCLLF